MKIWTEANALWITVLGGVIATGVTLTAYAYATFQTKEATREYGSMIEKRLDRMENKIDEMNNYLRKRRGD